MLNAGPEAAAVPGLSRRPSPRRGGRQRPLLALGRLRRTRGQTAARPKEDGSLQGPPAGLLSVLRSDRDRTGQAGGGASAPACAGHGCRPPRWPPRWVFHARCCALSCCNVASASRRDPPSLLFLSTGQAAPGPQASDSAASAMAAPRAGRETRGPRLPKRVLCFTSVCQSLWFYDFPGTGRAVLALTRDVPPGVAGGLGTGSGPGWPGGDGQ